MNKIVDLNLIPQELKDYYHILPVTYILLQNNDIRVYFDEIYDVWHKFSYPPKWQKIISETKNLIIDDNFINIINFDYTSGNDKHPKILYFRKYTGKNGNDIISGVNLNYLDENEIIELMNGVERIFMMNEDNRFLHFSVILPNLTEYYRSYSIDKMENIKITQEIVS